MGLGFGGFSGLGLGWWSAGVGWRSGSFGWSLVG